MRGAVCLCWPIERRESLNILWDPFPLCCFLLRLLRCRNGQPQNGNLSTNATTTELCSKHPGRQTTLVQSSTRRSRLFPHPSVAHPRFGPPSSSSCRASKFRNANFLSPYKTRRYFRPQQQQQWTALGRVRAFGLSTFAAPGGLENHV